MKAASVVEFRFFSSRNKFKGKNSGAVLLTLLAEIEFRGWTDDGNLRHAF
jgi:hypothetical protein